MATRKNANAPKKGNPFEDSDPPIIIAGGSGSNLRGQSQVHIRYKDTEGKDKDRRPQNNDSDQITGVQINVFLDDLPEPTLSYSDYDDYRIEVTFFTSGTIAKRSNGRSSSRTSGASKGTGGAKASGKSGAPAKKRSGR